MRYITRFEIPKDTPKSYLNGFDYVQSLKNKYSCGLANSIAESVGFEESFNELDECNRYTMEIQAFSQKDWVEFKKEIGLHIKNTFPEGRKEYELVQFKSMFDRLENIGIDKEVLNK